MLIQFFHAAAVSYNQWNTAFFLILFSSIFPFWITIVGSRQKTPTIFCFSLKTMQWYILLKQKSKKHIMRLQWDIKCQTCSHCAQCDRAVKSNIVIRETVCLPKMGSKKKHTERNGCTYNHCNFIQHNSTPIK